MVQTLHNRIKKEQININDYDYLIVDEAHRGEFMKIVSQFKGKVIGFTATPNYEKIYYFFKCLNCGVNYDINKNCCGKNTKKYKSNVPLSSYYDTLIHGAEINDLIEQGYLVKDENYILEVDTSRLVYDENRNEYTEESIGLVFGSKNAIQNTIDVYKKLCYGKKTILFNPNTLVNKLLYEAMLIEGLNVKMFDSNNSNESREDLIDWFKVTKDAILLNVPVFTTGFDCDDVEVVFLNKKTKSVNLFLQMVGRGARITDKIFKPSFSVIDMGNNINDLGNWSDKRDWEDYFNRQEIKECGKPQPASVRDCHECKAIIPSNSLKCPFCGVERLYSGGGVIGLPKIDGKPIIPNPNKIIEYCENNKLTTLDARKMIIDYVVKMFYGIDEKSYWYHRGTLDFKNRLWKFILPYYFAVQKSNLEGNKNRKLDTFIEDIINKIDKHYD